MIVVTGGAGFIGSAFVWKLNASGRDDIIIVDCLGETDKWKNLVNLRWVDYIHKEHFLKMVLEDRIPFEVSSIVHMGACSSTMERDADYLMENNYRYSVHVATWALRHDVRFMYASSAATYGDGLKGFSDDHSLIPMLHPVNMYGYSKQVFDLWVFRNHLEDKIVGIKFFNVFGPNEYHKGDMRSVVHKAYHQILETGQVRLFKSHRSDYGDGDQMRDFVYIKDCVEDMDWLLNHPEVNGIFNLGTGQARTWNDLIHAVFSAIGRKPKIEYIDMPPAIRSQYQYFTEAEISKIRSSGSPADFQPLEETVRDYIVNHLQQADPYLRFAS